MRSMLSVCSLTVIVGCSAGSDETAYRAGEIREGDSVYLTDASLNDPFEHKLPSCGPQDAGPVYPVDAAAEESAGCGPYVHFPAQCIPREELYDRMYYFCGEKQRAEGDTVPLPQCPGLAGDTWVRCCPAMRNASYDAGVPVPDDAAAPSPTPTPPTPTNCELLRLGDDRTCYDAEAYESEARSSCSARGGELKSLTLLGADCAGGASAAQATCCLSTWI